MRVGNPALPAGYDYDAVNADVLLHGATVKGGRVTLASGANYAVLILPPDEVNLTPPVLGRLRELVRAGVTLVGPRPQHSPSLTGYPECDAQVKQLAEELWGKCDGRDVKENICGQGRVVWGQPLAEIFAAQKLLPDFAVQGGTNQARLAYAHRVAGGADIYFVSNQRRQFASAECTFRVSGKVPELWHPDTGVREPAPVWNTRDGVTTVRLNFEPAGSVFVVFRQSAAGADHCVAASGNFAGAATGNAPKLEIQHARYAATDGAEGKDVTATVARLVGEGQFAIDVNNSALGGDPAANHTKELRVDYTIDGRPGQATAAEHETLVLPGVTTIGPAPQWEVSAMAGVPVVKAWANGQVELRQAGGGTLHATAAGVPAPQAITGGWKLSFPPNWGAPPAVVLDSLTSWSAHTNAGVRYFSGTATYEKDIEISAPRLGADRELWLDLGAVKNLAEVSLNGKNLGVLWKPPFRVQLTGAARPGVNKLVVKVTNLWPNRLIGDEQLPPDCEWNGSELKAWPQWLLDGKPSPTGRLTFAAWHHWKKNSPLLESGLLGPVTLRTAEIFSAK